MIQSVADDKTGTVPPKPLPRKIIAMGSINLTNSDFLAWREQHCPSLAARDAMLMYMRYLNGEDKIRFEQEMKLGENNIELSFPHISDIMWSISQLTEMNWKLQSQNRKL
jgi:hypothetical protein